MAVDDTPHPVEVTASSAVQQIAGPQHVGTGTGHPAPPPSGPAGTVPASLTSTAPAALDLGWTMAELAAAVAHPVTIGDLERIPPTKHEMDRLPRSRLQAVRISCLSATLGGLLPAGQEPMPGEELANRKARLDGNGVDWAAAGGGVRAGPLCLQREPRTWRTDDAGHRRNDRSADGCFAHRPEVAPRRRCGCAPPTQVTHRGMAVRGQPSLLLLGETGTARQRGRHAWFSDRGR